MTESGAWAQDPASPLATNSLISWGFLGGWCVQRLTGVTEVLVDYGIKWEYISIKGERMEKFYIYNTEGQLVDVIDSVQKAFEFMENEGSYIVKEEER